MKPVRYLYKGKFAPVAIMFIVSICLFFVTRFFLFIQASHHTNISIAQLLYVFSIGFCYDVCVACFIAAPLVFQIAFANEAIYKKPYCWLAAGFFSIALFILFFTKLLPKEFSAELYKGVEMYILARFIIYLALLFAGKAARLQWRKIILFAIVFIITFLLLFNAVSEWFFWNEFSARYNFIAVDYLIYTTEVLGNIKESYPVVKIILLLALTSLTIVVLVRKNIAVSVKVALPVKIKMLAIAGVVALSCIACNILTRSWMQKSDNSFANELSGNGLYTFGNAFFNNELDFYTYYQTLPDKEAFANVRKSLAGPNVVFTGNDSLGIERNITCPGPENKMNVVLISVESLSAVFMKAFGNTENITPRLDSLAQQSLMFTNFYASGTRTVRGLEAITLSIPPTPGQSTVKRPDNGNLFSLGAVLKSKGYATQYIYGGYSYFDNMKQFFTSNGYEVIDRDALKPGEIHFANIWGVADEDLFTLSLRTLDNNYKTGRPFFSHIMTVSNHRPFTYPDGRIDIPSASKSRSGAVKYTDYAIGKFIADARKKPWFSNTIFVIVADHCASSAGSADLPVTGYHIPMLIYSPAYIKPQNISQLTAQIDIAPTILGLLKMSYRSKFFGKDMLAPGAEQRALISTYQGLGFCKNGQLVIQSPVKKVKGYKPDFTTGESKKIPVNDSLSREAIAYYQCASWLLKNKLYNFK